MKLSTLLYFCFVMFCEGKSWSCHLVTYKCATFLSSLFRPQALRGWKGWRSIRGHIKIYSNGRSCQATNALSVFLSVQYVYVYVCVCVCHALIVCTHESLLFEAEQEMETRAFTRVVPPSMKKNKVATTLDPDMLGGLGIISCPRLNGNRTELIVTTVLSETVTTLRKQSVKNSWCAFLGCRPRRYLDDYVCAALTLLSLRCLLVVWNV